MSLHAELPRNQTPQKCIPNGTGSLFIYPLDPEDIFRVGQKYLVRWFRSEVIVPKGALSWAHSEILGPYACALAEALSALNHPTRAVVFSDRYVLDGADYNPPLRVRLPLCPMITLRMALCQLEEVLRSAQGTTDESKTVDDVVWYLNKIRPMLEESVYARASADLPKIKTVLE